MAEEKKTLGLYLTGHPISRFSEELARFTNSRVIDIVTATQAQSQGRAGDKTVILAGLVVAVRTRNSVRGGRMAFLTLDDRTARIELRVFGEVYEKHKQLLVDDQVLVVQGTLSHDRFSDSMRLTAERLLDIDAARGEYAQRLVLNLDASLFGNGLLDELAGALKPYRRQGQCSVWVRYSRPGARVQLVFDQSWRVLPAESLLRDLKKLVGQDKVQLEYRA